MPTVPHATDAELEALLRLASARNVLDDALIGDPTWLTSGAMRALAELVEAGARWLQRAEEMPRG